MSDSVKDMVRIDDGVVWVRVRADIPGADWSDAWSPIVEGEPEVRAKVTRANAADIRAAIRYAVKRALAKRIRP